MKWQTLGTSYPGMRVKAQGVLAPFSQCINSICLYHITRYLKIQTTDCPPTPSLLTPVCSQFLSSDQESIINSSRTCFFPLLVCLLPLFCPSRLWALQILLCQQVWNTRPSPLPPWYTSSNGGSGPSRTNPSDWSGASGIWCSWCRPGGV